MGFSCAEESETGLISKDWELPFGVEVLASSPSFSKEESVRVLVDAEDFSDASASIFSSCFLNFAFSPPKATFFERL